MNNDKHKSAVENVQDQIAEIASSLKSRFVGNKYQWPDWDENKLGKPPLIVMPSAQVPSDVIEFNNTLSNISKMASVDSAEELRSQLKALSGVPINIKDLTGNADPNTPPIGTPLVSAQKKQIGNNPEISFNPNVWGRYPVEGSATEHGIASPEQMMIHELGHYIEIQKIADRLKQANAQSNVPVAADKNDNIAYHHAVIDESHIIKDYENPAMVSVDPSFKKRDPNRYSDARILFENKDGYPDVAEQDRQALIHSMEMSRRDVPEQLNIPVAPKHSSANVEQKQDANLVATNVILNLYFSKLAKEGITPTNLESLQRLTSNTTKSNAENGTLVAVEINEKLHQQNIGHELT